jgi:hypothetical protein
MGNDELESVVKFKNHILFAYPWFFYQYLQTMIHVEI